MLVDQKTAAAVSSYDPADAHAPLMATSVSCTKALSTLPWATLMGIGVAMKEVTARSACFPRKLPLTTVLSAT